MHEAKRPATHQGGPEQIGQDRHLMENGRRHRRPAASRAGIVRAAREGVGDAAANVPFDTQRGVSVIVAAAGAFASDLALLALRRGFISLVLIRAGGASARLTVRWCAYPPEVGALTTLLGR